MKQAPPKDVETYIAAAPAEARPMLEKLRKAMRAAMPKANEIISYTIPTYKYGKGKLPVQPTSDFPNGLAQPAQRALTAAGYQNLKQLSKISEAEIKKLHGIGPNAIDLLRRALEAKGGSFAKTK